MTLSAKARRAKGHQGERDWAIFLRGYGRKAARGFQARGGDEAPDVVDVGAIEHWEVKRCESLSIYKAMAQAESEAREGSIPVVAHRRNCKRWLVILRAEDYLKQSDGAAKWRGEFKPEFTRGEV